MRPHHIIVLALLSAACGGGQAPAATPATDDAPTLVATPTSEPDGTEADQDVGRSDLTPIAGTWEGSSEPGAATIHVRVTILDEPGDEGRAGTVEHLLTAGGEPACTGTLVVRDGTPPVYEFDEEEGDDGHCDGGYRRLEHDVETDTLTFAFDQSNPVTATLERVEDD